MLTRKTLTQLLVVTILAITAKPLMAQAAYGESHPLRYRVIDVGTFGGATAQTNGSRIENNAGTVAGEADTNQPCPYAGGF